MTIKQIESALNAANIGVKDIKIINNVVIKLKDGGAIHIAGNGDISVNGTAERVKEVYGALKDSGHYGGLS